MKQKDKILPFLLVSPCVNNNTSVSQGLGSISGVFPKLTGLNNCSTTANLFFYIINILLYVSFGVTVIFVIYGGFLYITAAGNEEQSTKGRKAVTYAVIGIVIIVLSYVIINVLVNTLLS